MVCDRTTVGAPAAVQVLIVEDDSFQQFTLRMMLEQCAASSGVLVEVSLSFSREGSLQACSKQHFDLVLLDLLLPDGKSDSIVPFIRRAQSRNTELVVLSGGLQESSMQHCVTLGADSYRVKPVRSCALSPGSGPCDSPYNVQLRPTSHRCLSLLYYLIFSPRVPRRFRTTPWRRSSRFCWQSGGSSSSSGSENDDCHLSRTFLRWPFPCWTSSTTCARMPAEARA